MLKISIGQKEYFCKIRYSKRARYLRLQINPEKGIEVVVPEGLSFFEAERFLQKNIWWIEKNIDKCTSNPEGFYYLGEKVNLIHQYDMFSRRNIAELKDGNLKIISPAGKNISINNLFKTWLKKMAESIIPERAMYLAKKYNFNIRRISIRNQKTRWGSCSGNGNLSFNFKLMLYDMQVIDYVIIHELCHLKEMNHSKKFWNLVEKIIPDYKIQRNKLKKKII